MSLLALINKVTPEKSVWRLVGLLISSHGLCHPTETIGETMTELAPVVVLNYTQTQGTQYHV